MVSRNPWAHVVAWVLLCFAVRSAALAQGILLSSKEQSTSIRLGDEAYLPGDGFPVGPFHLHPFLRQRLDFDDNVFLDHRDPTRGLFYALTGGARLDLLPGNHTFSVGYKARGVVRLYSQGPEFTDPAEEEAYEGKLDGLTRVEHIADLRNILVFPWGRFALTGGYERLSDPLNFTYTRHIRRHVWTGG
ncbi:MAG: hypothetical protein ACYTHM_25225, partial [Planctomycetota bacterium]